LFFRRSATPSQWFRAQRYPIFGGSLCVHPLTHNDPIKTTHVERGVFLGVNHASHPKGAEGGAPALPNFWVPLHLCLHPSTQNDRIRRGNTYRERLVLEGQPHLPSQRVRPREPSGPQFWGSPILMRTEYTTTKLCVVTHMGSGVF